MAVITKIRLMNYGNWKTRCRNISLLWGCLAFSLASISQDKKGAPGIVQGNIQDSASGKAIAYATVGILDAGEKNIALIYSDEQGRFRAEVPGQGAYLLKVSFVGYLTATVPFMVSDGKKHVELGTVSLQPDSKLLKGITIIGKKRLIEQKPGMLVYNAENDITNKGGSAVDVLRKSPVLGVDANGKVTMRGSGNIKILVNGKFTGQMARNPGDALNMIPANTIKAVEVITSPSARYDAEGAAGVVNIITKKNKEPLSMALEGVLSNREQALNPRLGFSWNRWTVNASGHFHRLRDKEASFLRRSEYRDGEELSVLEQDVTKENIMPHGYAEVNVDYAVDSVSLLSLSATGWRGNWPVNNQLHSRTSLPGGTVQSEYSQELETKAPNNGADLNLVYNRKLKQHGQELFIMVQHIRGIDDMDYKAVRRNNAKELLYLEQNNNNTNNREWTLQTDYVHPLAHGKHTLETGVKAIFRHINSIYDVAASEPQQPDVPVHQPDRSDAFDYTQQVLAGYATLKFNWDNNWSLQAGARMEATSLEGKYKAAAFSSSYNNLVPAATIAKKINDAHHFSLSYTQRISRPSIWDLNPNVDASDPQNLVTGNPDLRPVIAHQTELAYGLSAASGLFLHTAFYWRQINNSIEDIVFIDDNGVSTTTKQNLAANKQYGVNISTSFNIQQAWSLNSNIRAACLKYNSGSLHILSEGWAWGINLNSTYRLPHDFALQAFGDYDSKESTLQGSKTSHFYYSLGVKKELPENKISISLSAINPFNNYIRQTEIMRTAGFTSAFTNRYYERAVKLAVSWEFGQIFQQTKGKKIHNDDIKGNNKG